MDHRQFRALGYIGKSQLMGLLQAQGGIEGYPFVLRGDFREACRRDSHRGGGCCFCDVAGGKFVYENKRSLGVSP